MNAFDKPAVNGEKREDKNSSILSESEEA